MKIPKLKSHTPKFHDNTESNIILVCPEVLDNKLRHLEIHEKVWGRLGTEIGLLAALLIAFFTNAFPDHRFVSGGTVRGAFLFAAIYMIIRISRDWLLLGKANGHTRAAIIDALLKEGKDKKIYNADKKA